MNVGVKKKGRMEVWSWGAGTHGQLGCHGMEDSLLPQRVPALEAECVKEMACGGAHAAAALGNGQVVTWGRGNSGELGHGDRDKDAAPCAAPKPVAGLQGVRIRSVAAGWSHTAFVAECGGLYTCGAGAFGQLGLGHFQARPQPCRVASLDSLPVSMAACGMRHTLVLAAGAAGEDAAVFAFGACRHGQLGFFPFSDNYAQEQDLGNWQVRAKEVARLCHPRKLRFQDRDRIRAVAANGHRSAAITESGALFVWGRGYGPSPDMPLPAKATGDVRFTQVALGWSHGLGLLEDGQVLSWGSNQRGQLGSQEQFCDSSHHRPLQDVTDSSGALHHVPVWTCRLHFYRVQGLGGRATCISAGAEHSAVVLDSGEVKLWGWGEHGQLGSGIDDQEIPHTVPLPSTTGTDVQCRVFCGSGFTFVTRHLECPKFHTMPMSNHVADLSTQEKQSKRRKQALVMARPLAPPSAHSFQACTY